MAMPARISAPSYSNELRRRPFLGAEPSPLYAIKPCRGAGPTCPEETSMQTMTCIEDLRSAAHRKVPRAFIDYAEAGSYAEQTLRANRDDLERIKLRQRILFDV